MAAAVIFDLYGTLLQLSRDSKPFYQLARRTRRLDLRVALHQAITRDCPRLADFAAIIGLPPQDDLPSLEANLLSEIAAVEMYPDVLPTLENLKKRNVKTAIISNLATPYIKPLIDSPILDFVQTAIFSCECGFAKPEKKIYQLALDRIGTLPNETIMVGDSFKSDVEGPSKFGIKGVHLIRSGLSHSTFTSITSLSELSELIFL